PPEDASPSAPAEFRIDLLNPTERRSPPAIAVLAASGQRQARDASQTPNVARRTEPAASWQYSPHAISRTTPTTPIRTNSGCENSRRKLESPVEAGFRTSLGNVMPSNLAPCGSP